MNKRDTQVVTNDENGYNWDSGGTADVKPDCGGIKVYGNGAIYLGEL